MNRLAGFALIGGLLAISAAASGTGASHAAYERNAYLAAPAVGQSTVSAVEALPAAAATVAPANPSTRTIPASQIPTHPALQPAAAEQAPASQASPNSCPPARMDIACRRP
jgi:hypothetical protein